MDDWVLLVDSRNEAVHVERVNDYENDPPGHTWEVVSRGTEKYCRHRARMHQIERDAGLLPQRADG